MPLNIVYIDDESDLLDMFVDLYSSDDVKIQTFTQPQLAIAAIEENKPDLVILDFRLPGMTGDEVALQLDSDITKVLITGDLSADPQAQFAKVFKKPYRYKEMSDFLDDFKNKNSVKK